MILLGIIIILFGLFMLYLRPQLSDKDQFEDGVLIRRKAPPFFLMFTKKISLVLAGAGLLIANAPLHVLLG
ncbi:hypothetical protein [Ekhidna sp.]|uniref:hypothetical protein n=1 Tax=Ekhidna sp. TaxID=2608089 RepID=UPI003298FDCB